MALIDGTYHPALGNIKLGATWGEDKLGVNILAHIETTIWSEVSYKV